MTIPVSGPCGAFITSSSSILRIFPRLAAPPNDPNPAEGSPPAAASKKNSCGPEGSVSAEIYFLFHYEEEGGIMRKGRSA